MHLVSPSPVDLLPLLPPATAPQWTPTRPGYLRFLTESKVVYDTFDRLVNTSDACGSGNGRGTSAREPCGPVLPHSGAQARGSGQGASACRTTLQGAHLMLQQKAGL